MSSSSTNVFSSQLEAGIVKIEGVLKDLYTLAAHAKQGRYPQLAAGGDAGGGEGEGGGKKARKMKKPRDPDEPARPPSAFLMFCKDKRAKFTGEGKLTAEVLGGMFKEISEDTKAKYTARAEKDMQAWRVSLDEYRASRGLPPRAKSKKEKEAGAAEGDSDSDEEDSDDQPPPKKSKAAPPAPKAEEKKDKKEKKEKKDKKDK